MPNFILAYHGEPKKPSNPEEGQTHMAEWKAWIKDMGEAIINPGFPLGEAKTVDSEGVADCVWSDQMSGFSVVKADNLELAIEIAKTCPYVAIGGTLKVAEMREMPM